MPSVVEQRPAAESMGARLQQAREARELNQSDLAAQAGLPRSVVNDLEHDRPRDLGVLKFYRLADTLGVSMEWLLGKPDLCSRSEPEDWFDHIDWQQPDMAALREAALLLPLHPADLRLLAGIAYRGQRPHTAAQWGLLHSVIRLAIQHAEAWAWINPTERTDNGRIH